jgi:ankyrin repeat protein
MDLIEEFFDLIAEGKPQHIREFVATECDINFQIEDGVTPLMMAANSGNLEIVQLLVQAGANVNHVDVYGNSSLMYAAWEGFWDIFDYLAPLTAQEVRGTHLLAAASDGENRIIQALITTHINVDSYRQKGVWSENGMTALIIAAQEGYSTAVKLLLDASANPNFADEDTGRKPLIYAVGSGNIETVRLLLKAGADVNHQDFNGETAIMKAAEIGNVEITKILLQSGADISVKNSDAKLALNYAIENNYTEIIQLLTG